MSDLTIGDYTAAVTIDGGTHYLLIQPGNVSTAYRKINRDVLLGVTGQPADISTAQNLTNKTLDNTNTITVKDSLFTLQDNSDTTKQAQFQLSGITTATTRTYTLPNASSTLADIATAQTFTNKTLTAPIISGGTISNSTITVDAIGEFTVANGVTIDGLNIKDGALNTNNSVVTANVTDGAITPAKLTAGTGSGWSWQSWVPTWANLTTGNGTLNYAKYIQVGKTVFFRFKFTLGNTSAVGTAPTFTLPVTANADYTDSNPDTWTSVVKFVDTGTAAYSGFVTWGSSTTGLLRTSNVAGTAPTDTNVTAAVPFAFANTDVISASGFYEAA